MGHWRWEITRSFPILVAAPWKLAARQRTLVLTIMNLWEGLSPGHVVFQETIYQSGQD